MASVTMLYVIHSNSSCITFQFAKSNTVENEQDLVLVSYHTKKALRGQKEVATNYVLSTRFII